MIFLILILLILFLAILIQIGPRIEIDSTLQPVDLPEDLDQHLATSEAAYSDLIPGTEKTIIWAGEPGQKTPLSIIYLHGFSATRQETAPLAEEVAAHLGANLYYNRFKGHGRSGEALAEATVNDWLNDANEALEIGRRLGDKVIILATSTGGSAATWLVAQPENEDVHALVLISPNFEPANSTSKILSWPWGEQLANLIIGRERSWEPSNELHGRYWTNSYPTKALLPMMGLVELAQTADIQNVHTPLMLVYSPNDQVVSPAASEAAFTRYGAPNKEILAIEQSDNPSNHVIAGNIRSPGTNAEIRDAIISFLESLP